MYYTVRAQRYCLLCHQNNESRLCILSLRLNENASTSPSVLPYIPPTALSLPTRNASFKIHRTFCKSTPEYHVPATMRSGSLHSDFALYQCLEVDWHKPTGLWSVSANHKLPFGVARTDLRFWFFPRIHQSTTSTQAPSFTNLCQLQKLARDIYASHGPAQRTLPYIQCHRIFNRFFIQCKYLLNRLRF